jgi:hypothetical protein
MTRLLVLCALVAACGIESEPYPERVNVCVQRDDTISASISGVSVTVHPEGVTKELELPDGFDPQSDFGFVLAWDHDVSGDVSLTVVVEDASGPIGQSCATWSMEAIPYDEGKVPVCVTSAAAPSPPCPAPARCDNRVPSCFSGN